MQNKDPNDKFWDIEELLPARPVKKKPVHTPRDLSAVEVAIPAEPQKKETLGAPIPARDPIKPRERKILREYEPHHGFLQKVTVMPWPTDFGFYAKFRRDAIRLFERTHEPAEYVYFFSYMPQYDQMTAAQLAYYLYWRGELRRGIYLKADINYLFLYIYEIINLPDRVPPEEGTRILSRLWAAYRNDFRYLDKYLGEWLCDYCLIHKTVPDLPVLEVFSHEIATKVSMPEFYLYNSTLTWPLIQSISAYDYRSGKYYEEGKALFDTHIPLAAEYVTAALITPHLESYGVTPTRTLRDSFSGAVACHDIKFKIAVTYTPLRRSLELRQALSGIIKLCENQVRMALGIKSRFAPTGVTEEMKQAVIAYFDTVWPERARRIKKTADALEEARYMALYEPKQTGKADISRALAIEEAAWETAELLGAEEEEASLPPPEKATSPIEESPIPIEEAPIPTEADSEFAFLLTLEPLHLGALSAALDGAFDAYCRQNGKMANMVRDALNELAADELGDMIIEEDFSLVADYEEDIRKLLGK